MDIVELAVKTRQTMGTRPARALRRQGIIPAILYGHGMEPLTLEVNARALHNVLRTKAGENVVINLKVEGKGLKESTCRVKEIQHNPVSDAIDHVDFTIISLTERIEVKVPLVVKNKDEAVGVKEGGILDVVHHEIEVECLPTQIPERIEVDVKEMKIGDSLQLKDLAIPENVTAKLAPTEVIVSLHPPAKEEVAPAAEEAPTEPEVIAKEKKEEGAPAEEAPKTQEAAKSAEKKK